MNKPNKILVLGLLIIVALLGFRVMGDDNLFFRGEVKTTSENRLPKPNKIVIEKVNINLKVEEGNVLNGKWEVSENFASHLSSSQSPSGNGNIVIYGHNKDSIFGPIRWLSEGDEIKLINEEGKEFGYKVEKTLEVSANDIQWVNPKNEETLTLYTCTGFLDLKRYIVIAKPYEES